jgi:hypothetical protein
VVGSRAGLGLLAVALMFAFGPFLPEAHAAFPINPSGLTIEPDLAGPGTIVSLTVRGRPGQTAVIAFSRQGAGGRVGDHPLQLGPDFALLAAGQVDGAGRFVFSVPVPATVANGPVFLQAGTADDAALTQNLTLTNGVSIFLGPGSIIGRVRDLDSGQSIEGARVFLQGTSVAAVTEADGSYALGDVHPGTYTVEAQASGYDPTTSPVTIGAGERRDHEVRLQRRVAAANVTGSVVRQQGGAPVAGALVSLNGADALPVVTEADGQFAFAGIPAGEYSVTAVHALFIQKTENVDIVAGQTAALQLRLSPIGTPVPTPTAGATGSIAGTVTAAGSGTPIAGATVAVNGTTLATSTGGNGTYQLAQVPAGTYTVAIEASGFTGQNIPVAVLGGQTQIVEAFLTAVGAAPSTGTIHGVVFHEVTGTSVAGATVILDAGAATVQTDGTGAFTIPDVQAGTHTLLVSALGFFARLTPGITVPDDEAVQIGLPPQFQPVGAQAEQALAGAQLRTLGLHRAAAPAPRPGSLDLVVQEAATGGALSGAQAAIESESLVGGGSFQTTGTTAADGSLSFVDLAPGTYTLSVSLGGFLTARYPGIPIRRIVLYSPTSLLLGNVAAERTLVSRPLFGVRNLNPPSPFLPVSLSRIRLRLPATFVQPTGLISLGGLTGSATGTVEREEGGRRIPLANATVILAGTGRTVQTDAQGRFSLDRLPVGTRQVTVVAPGFEPLSLDLAVTPGGRTTLAPRLASSRTGSATLRGTVRGAATGGTVAGATVTVDGVEGSASTAADGSFAFPGLPFGTYTVRAAAPGFQEASLEVSLGPVTPAATIYLTAASTTGVVAGTVTSAESGGGIAGASVVIEETGAAASTGPDGAYRFAGVPAGAQSVRASANGFASQSRVVTVAGGRTSTASFALERATGSLRGQVVDAATRAPIAGATVSVDGTRLTATTDSAGTYRFATVAVGQLTVRVAASGFLSQSQSVIVSAGATATLNFSLSPLLIRPVPPPVPRLPLTGTVSGRVTSSTGTAIGGATVSVSGTSLSATTDASGNYTIGGVAPGTYTVTASASGFLDQAQTVSVTAGATATLNFSLSPLLIRPVPPPVPRLPLTGTVSGRVTSSAGAAIAGATLSVGGTSLTATTDASGNYRLDGVPAGTQTVTATAAGFLSRAQTVSVTAGATATLTFTLSPVVVALPPPLPPRVLPTTGTVTGRVTTSGGTGIGGATVTVSGTTLSATTSSLGTYTISGVPAGSRSLTASAAGFLSRSQAVSVTAGATVTLNFTLTPTLVLTPRLPGL